MSEQQDITTPLPPRRERTPEEEVEWLEDKRAEHDADRMAGDCWSNW